MKNIIDIYKEYKIMPNLVMHQIRVSAVAMQICESLDIEVEKENIIKACLLHDMGNIIKFQLDLFPEWNKPAGIEYWKIVKNEYVSKYGENEHHASVAIALELGINSRVCDLINCIDSTVIEKIMAEEDFDKKICAYVDNRVTPYGVVPAEEHGIDAIERYKNHPHAFTEESRLSFMENLHIIEEQIFSHTKIKPEDINDDSIKDYLEKLKSFSI